ncbi:hypothetical protein CPS_1399 [Colwellia psychrerythraea 34H]|uniref:Uncharacterized protein n=1 Tax=Colwellia psychrerythraea (strain 34H / ATCC BAA-681) TaxID=167879 RepID=Q485X3_COLP3|nr:hypothetical protein CPS_1399 [Colwellia psychrerythraea 34H]
MMSVFINWPYILPTIGENLNYSLNISSYLAKL